MSKIKIGIIRRNSGEFGGIEHQVVNIALCLHDEYDFYLITDDITSKMAEQFKNYGEVIHVPFNKRHILKSGKMIAEICKHKGIKVLQSHMFRESFYGRCAKFYEHDISHLYRVHTYIDCSFIPIWKKNLYHVLAKLTDRYVDKYLSINGVNKAELMNRSHISSAKIEIIHNGVRPFNAAIDDMKADEKNHNIALVGNLLWERGYDIALKALRLLLDNDTSYMLYLIGGENSSQGKSENGPVYQRIVSLANELNVLDHIVFYGFTNDVPTALKNCSIVILPAYDAGTPNCLLEVMTINKIVIASRVGGIPEFIHHGVTGYLHDNKDFATLANLIRKVDTIPTEELLQIKKAGYKIWKDEFAISSLRNNLKRIYQSCLMR